MSRKPIDWDNVEPWERQKGETAKAFEGFRTYRDFGPKRSLTAVSRVVAKSRAFMSRWSMRWNWVERATAWDMEQDRVMREARQDEVKEMNRRHVQIVRAAQGKAIEALSLFSPASIRSRLGEVVAALVEIMKMERLILGESTERLDVVAKVRQLAKDWGLTETEEQQAVAVAEAIIRHG